jgi:hypothetical protein
MHLEEFNLLNITHRHLSATHVAILRVVGKRIKIHL